MSNQAHKHADWMQAQKFFLRHFDFLSVEDKDLLQDWELILCDVSTLESVALLPRLSRSFDRMKAVVVEHSDKLKLQKKCLWWIAWRAAICRVSQCVAFVPCF